MAPDDAALALARDLVQRASITPEDAGCQALIAARLERAGFACRHLGVGDVDNLWAIAGQRPGPLLCFAGHTDVVPSGDADAWRFPPFSGAVHDGFLHGRGAADMKTGVAAMVCAAERFRAAYPDHAGRLAMLLTSDEEGPAVDGTRAVVDWLDAHGVHIDYCVLGEPSSENTLADTVKVGRRGSLSAHISVAGRQGHVAYPAGADNAAHRLLGLLHDLIATRWDDGDDLFPPSSFQITNVAAGSGATNVVPGRAEARCNWRFNTCHSADSLQHYVAGRCRAHGIAASAIDWQLSGQPFVTRSGKLIDASQRAIAARFGAEAARSTSGGTSDARYIAPGGAEVVEIGPCNATIHQIDERVDARAPAALADVYAAIAADLLAD